MQGMPPKKKGMPWWAWVGMAFLLFFAGCVAICAIGIKGVSDQAEKEKEEFEKAEAIKVTAAELAAAYKKNEVAADEKYKGKKIEITGTVESIDSGAGDEPRVQLEGGEMFITVTLQDIPKDEAKKLSKGDKVKAVCKGDGEIIGFPKLKDCKLK